MEPRTSFTPDALAKFAALFEEVWSELVLTRVLEPDADAELVPIPFGKTRFPACTVAV